VEEPRGTRTTRRIVLSKPQRVRRDPVDQARVWRQRQRSFGTGAVIWLVLAAAGVLTGWSAAAVVLMFAAGVLSLAVVVKAQIHVQRGERAR